MVVVNGLASIEKPAAGIPCSHVHPHDVSEISEERGIFRTSSRHRDVGAHRSRPAVCSGIDPFPDSRAEPLAAADGEKGESAEASGGGVQMRVHSSDAAGVEVAVIRGIGSERRHAGADPGREARAQIAVDGLASFFIQRRPNRGVVQLFEIFARDLGFVLFRLPHLLAQRIVYLFQLFALPLRLFVEFGLRGLARLEHFVAKPGCFALHVEVRNLRLTDSDGPGGLFVRLAVFLGIFDSLASCVSRRWTRGPRAEAVLVAPGPWVCGVVETRVRDGNPFRRS